MDKIWDRKSFEVGGHWPLWREWPRRTDKSRTLKKRKKEVQRIPIKSSVFYHIHTLFYNFTTLYAKHYQFFSLNKNNSCYYKKLFFLQQDVFAPLDGLVEIVILTSMNATAVWTFATRLVIITWNVIICMEALDVSAEVDTGNWVVQINAKVR